MSQAFNRTNACASPQATGRKHRSILFVELVTTAALALSTAVAVTAVSIGMARADVLGAVKHGDGASLAIAVLHRFAVFGDGRAHRSDGARPPIGGSYAARIIWFAAGVGRGCHRRTSWDVRR